MFKMEPMLPADRRDLEELALDLFKASSKLAGRVHPVTRSRLVKLLRSVNSYYSNLIEGVRTTLLDIEASLRELSADDRTRRLQILHRQNILAQAAIESECSANKLGVASPEFLCHLHSLLFEGVPEEFLVQRDSKGTREIKMTPGTLREDDVSVGGYVPPPHGELNDLLRHFQKAYSLEAVSGVTRLVAAAAGHHRLLWIHPFLEGNGRVARLFTDVYLQCAGLEGYGLWTISRGLARRESDYKALLAGADAIRQGDYDGRGNLSERGLGAFCSFFLETALDQTKFMDELLGLDAIEKNITLYCTLRTQGHLAGKAPLPKGSAEILSHVFIHGQLRKGDVNKLTSTSDRTARDVVKVLIDEGLLETENQKAALTIGLPAGAVQYYFPELCDSGAF